MGLASRSPEGANSNSFRNRDRISAIPGNLSNILAITSCMTYVYIIRSLADPSRRYSGITKDLRQRLKEHNQGSSAHTAKYVPWRIETYLAFSERKRAIDFERYLKSGSGQAFSMKRL